MSRMRKMEHDVQTSIERIDENEYDIFQSSSHWSQIYGEYQKMDLT